MQVQVVWLVVAAVAAVGCARRVDVKDVKDARGPGQPTITIPYTGVREESRLYPDYGPIGAAILTDDAAAKPGKKGK